MSVNDRLRRQAASALLKIGAHDVALPLIRLLVNYATRCYLLLDAVQVLIDKDELEPVNALYDEVLDTSFLIPTMSSRTDVLLRLAELRLEQGDGAAALAAVRWIEAKKPMNISGGIQSGWPPWREEQPRRMILRGAENYHSALLTLAHRLIESQQPLLVSEICTEVVTLAAKLRGDARPVAILQTLGILAEMPIDAAVLELAHHAQALVERISDSVWQQRLLMALAKVYWMQGDLATAEGLATQIISLEDRAEAELWLALIDEQRLANTAALAARIGDQTRRAKVQSQLAEALRTRGRFAAAQQVAAQIHDPWMRGVSQRTGIRFLIKAERLADATALAAQIDQSHHRAMVQSDLVKAWIAAGQIAQATDLCAQIDEASYQAVAQYDLVSALSAAEQIEAAKAILTQMQPGRWRYRAHLELAQHLVDRERFTEAREIVVMLDDHDVDDTPYSYPAYFHKPLANAANQAAALRIIMNLQIDRGQLSEAEATLNLMSPQDRRELRISLATALIAANQIARATTLVTAVLNAIRMTDDATSYADVEPSSIERLAIHGHLRLAVALAHHIATPFIRVRALCSLALQLRRAGDDAAANSTFDAALAVAQAIDDTQTWQDLEFEQIRDLVEQDRISAAFDLARREPRIATNDHKPDMKLVIHCRTERFLALAQALERRGHTTEAIASIAEAAAIMRPVAARGIADYPLRRAVALLADLQRDAEALELALAIADPRQRADALLHLAYSLPAPSKTAIFHTILGIYGEEDHEYLVTYLHTKVAEHLIRQEEYDTLLTAIDWTDSKPLPLEKVAQCAYSGDGPLTGEPAVDKYRLRRRLMWILAGQGRTLKAQELLAKVEGYQQRSIEQRVLILALAAQGYAPAALAMAAGVTDKEQRSDLLLIVGEALITLGETAAAADLIARLSVTGLYAQERLIVLQQRIGHLSAAEAREKLQRIPLVQQPSAAHILAEHGATEMAVELLDSPAQQQGWETDTHVAARLALAQAYVAQGNLDAALIQLERLPKSVTHDPIRHPPRAFGTYVHQPDPPIAMAQNRSDALTKLAQIMVEQQQPIPALLAISHIDAAEMRINWLCEQIPLLITGNHHHAALAYVTALINAATQIQDTEERIDMLLCANQCFVEMEMYNQAADVARTALESVRHLHKPEDRASQQVEIVHALLSSHCPAEALDLAHRIDDTGKRVNALLAVAAVTPPTTWKQLNALVQRSWRTAQTYAEVLAMLPLAIPIIAEHPELSDALIECIG